MGHAIIVGRGAHLLTRPLRGGIHLRLIGSFEYRRDLIASRHGIDASVAADRITALDAGRRAYVKRHFNADVAEVRDYDLVINMEDLVIDEIADMLASRLARHATQAGIR